MNKNWKRISISAAIVVASVALTVALDDKVGIFQTLALKAQDAHFVLRGKVPTNDIFIIGVDEKAEDKIPDPSLFWQKYYAEAITAAAGAGAKTFVLDEAFGIPVAKWEPDADAGLAAAYAAATTTMPITSAFVANDADQTDPAFAVPVNMMAAALGGAAMANLTVDRDDFVRQQVLIETPQPGQASDSLKRSMPLRAAERFLGADASVRNGHVYLGKTLIPTNSELDMTINFAGPSDTFPRVSLYDFIQAARAGNKQQLEKWVKGKAVLLGPDLSKPPVDRHNTPFYFVTDKWQMAGVEIHANTLHTLLTKQFLVPVSGPVRIASMLMFSGITVAVATALGVAQTSIWSLVVILAGLIFSHVLFLSGWLLSATDLAIGSLWAMIGGIVYRFATAEKKSTFFKSAVALFVGKQVAKSLDQSDKISLTGKRVMVTILFTDIRGFTAFCESKDPAVVVDLLNDYMSKMVSIIVKYHGHVNKFIGDGILAVFTDEDEGAQAGGHARRCIQCAQEMVSLVIGDFKTGAGLHSGEVVIGNVGSSDKMEFTVLGDTVNLASRLESLNKENKTKMLLSEETRVIGGEGLDTFYLGAVPVRGKTEPMKIYTLGSLVSEDTLSHMSEEARAYHAREKENQTPVGAGA